MGEQLRGSAQTNNGQQSYASHWVSVCVCERRLFHWAACESSKKAQSKQFQCRIMSNCPPVWAQYCSAAHNTTHSLDVALSSAATSQEKESDSLSVCVYIYVCGCFCDLLISEAFEKAVEMNHDSLYSAVTVVLLLTPQRARTTTSPRCKIYKCLTLPFSPLSLRHASTLSVSLCVSACCLPPLCSLYWIVTCLLLPSASLMATFNCHCSLPLFFFFCLEFCAHKRDSNWTNENESQCGTTAVGASDRCEAFWVSVKLLLFGWKRLSHYQLSTSFWI